MDKSNSKKLPNGKRTIPKKSLQTHKTKEKVSLNKNEKIIEVKNWLINKAEENR